MCNKKLKTVMKKAAEENLHALQNVCRLHFEKDPIIITDLSLWSQLVAEIRKKNISIIQIVDNLELILVNTSSSKRAFGVKILYEILSRLPDRFLNTKQVSIISSFLCTKLKDHQEVLPPTLDCILAIIQFRYFSRNDVVEIINSLFQNFTCQQQRESDRYIFYKVVEKVLTNFLEDVKKMEYEFVYGIISAIDGERNPRNILHILQWIKILLENIALGPLQQEMFEIFSCYFPIDLKSQHKRNIATRDKLAKALCQCLCAIPGFSEMCIPLALEKLDSSLLTAKLDSLELLVAGCKNFQHESYLLYSSKILFQIQKEVLKSSDLAYTNNCLKTLTIVICKLSETDTISFHKILSEIVVTHKGNLVPSHGLFNSSSLILIATAAACSKSSSYITKEIFPVLENVCSTTVNDEGKVPVLDIITKLVTQVLQYNSENVAEIEEIGFIPLLHVLVTITENNNNSTELKCAAFKGLAVISKCVSDVHLGLLLGNIQSFIIQEVDENLREAILQCFKSLAIHHSKMLITTILYKENLNDPNALRLYLCALCSILNVQYFKNIINNIILRYLFENETSLITCRVLSEFLESNNDKEVTDIFLRNNLIEKLIDYAIAREHAFSSDVSNMLKLLIGSEDLNSQKIHVNELLLKIDNSCRNSRMIYGYLIKGLLIKLHKTIAYNNCCVNFALESCAHVEDTSQMNLFAQILAIFFNKYPICIYFQETLEFVNDLCKRSVYKLPVISWISKALLMRNHIAAAIWCDKLIQDLNDPQLAENIKIVMNKDCHILNEENHCNISPLYQQKLFMVASNKFMEYYCVQNNFISTNYETCCVLISTLLKYTPVQAINMQFHKIQKLILLCLQYSENSEVLETQLKILKEFIGTNYCIIEDNTFLERILQLTFFPKSMRVRIAALQCICNYTKYPNYILIPLKELVLRQLNICSDDNKRLVRKEAMETRLKWLW